MSMFSGRTTTSISAPAAAPVDFNAGKPTFGELAPLFGLALLALLPIGGFCISPQKDVLSEIV